MSLRVRAAAFGALLLAAAAAASCGGGIFGKQYEYEEDLYLATDGSAELIVNTSLPALVVLRGADLDPGRSARVDRDKLRAWYESPVTSVARISRAWTRHGRRFIQVRVKVRDVRKLDTVAPFSWSHYTLEEHDGIRVFRQVVSPPAFRPGSLQNVGWTGGELVAFRLHLPSRIVEHNARDIERNEGSKVERGNILSWEQLLTDRLDGRPVEIEVRMENQSILYRTLWLFGGAFAAAVLLLGGLIWLTVRKGASQEQAMS
jgi:hypothetical protein